MKQATFSATITDTTPGIVAALLDRADDPTTASHHQRIRRGHHRHRHVFGSSPSGIR